ncbi:MAG: hypothetical protein ACOC00_00805 [Halothiobacillaceae bacterium]
MAWLLVNMSKGAVRLLAQRTGSPGFFGLPFFAGFVPWPTERKWFAVTGRDLAGLVVLGH